MIVIMIIVIVNSSPLLLGREKYLVLKDLGVNSAQLWDKQLSYHILLLTSKPHVVRSPAVRLHKSLSRKSGVHEAIESKTRPMILGAGHSLAATRGDREVFSRMKCSGLVMMTARVRFVMSITNHVERVM